MTYLLAFDQGTTSSRAIVFDDGANIVSVAQKPFTQFFPHDAWVEHDPLEIWQSQFECAQQALQQAKLSAHQIAAIGITNQRETIVVWDRSTGQPVYRAIVWQDRRTYQMCEALKAKGLEDVFRRTTGLTLDPYFSGTKLAWLLENVAGLRARAQAGELAFGTIDTWLLWQLTEGRVHATDITNASRTLLYDIHRQEWSDELLAHLNIPRAILPQVQPSCSDFGYTDLLGARIDIGGIAGDQQAALFGQACHTDGMAKNTYGTGCFLLMHTGAKSCTSTQGLLTTPAAQCGASMQYALEGSVFVAGALIQWLRDELGIIKTADEIEALANQVSDNGGVYIVPAFVGLGAPYWDPQARGAILGLTRASSRAHIARAALEAIAFQVAELMQAMERDAQIEVPQLRVDGGAARNELLLQIQADLLGIPVVRAKTLEITALGAVYLAGLYKGVWQHPEEIAQRWQADKIFTPNMSRDQAQNKILQWKKAVERCRNWAM